MIGRYLIWVFKNPRLGTRRVSGRNKDWQKPVRLTSFNQFSSDQFPLPTRENHGSNAGAHRAWVLTCTQVNSFSCACQAPYCSIVLALFYLLFRRKSLIIKECSIVQRFLAFLGIPQKFPDKSSYSADFLCSRAKSPRI